MKNKEKVKEPFDPQRTPPPPQVTHPVSRDNEEDAGKILPKGNKKRQPEVETGKKSKVSGKSKTQIDGETSV